MLPPTLIPADDQERLQALAPYRVLGTSPDAVLLAFINNKPASDAEPNALTLQQVREVALRFDPTYLTLYGSVGAKGIINITTKQ